MEFQRWKAQTRAVNFDYSEEVLSPAEIKKLSKINRLRTINGCDDKISSLIIR